MIIAIPTYNRPELKSYELACSIVGEDKVYVFFHNKEDREQYKQNIKNVIITNAEKGIGRARNSILNYFCKGTEIIMMDDDITEIKILNLNKELEVLTPDQIKIEFEKAFEICKKNNIYLWGIYPIDNNFFMKHKISNKALMVGGIMGIRINDLRFDETLPMKEDYDYGLQNIKNFKKVARLDYLTCNAKFKAKGGLDYVYNSVKEKEACDILLNKWSEWLIRNPIKDSEVILKL